MPRIKPKVDRFVNQTNRSRGKSETGLGCCGGADDDSLSRSRRYQKQGYYEDRGSRLDTLSHDSIDWQESADSGVEVTRNTSFTGNSWSTRSGEVSEVQDAVLTTGESDSEPCNCEYCTNLANNEYEEASFSQPSGSIMMDEESTPVVLKSYPCRAIWLVQTRRRCCLFTVLLCSIVMSLVVLEYLGFFGNEQTKITFSRDSPFDGSPTSAPLFVPSLLPSEAPTPLPSIFPSDIPSAEPSYNPSPRPSRFPTRNPTKSPTLQPSRRPSRIPSLEPSGVPTASPSSVPSMHPTLHPTFASSRVIVGTRSSEPIP